MELSSIDSSTDTFRIYLLDGLNLDALDCLRPLAEGRRRHVALRRLQLGLQGQQRKLSKDPGGFCGPLGAYGIQFIADSTTSCQKFVASHARRREAVIIVAAKIDAVRVHTSMEATRR